MDNQRGGQYMIPQQQQPIIYPQNFGTPMRSCPLIGFGITLLIFSVVNGALAYWAMTFKMHQEYTYANMACSAFFLITGSFAVYGGQDISQRYCAIVTSMVLGILGVLAAIVGMITNVVAIGWFQNDCHRCYFEIEVSDSDHSIDAGCSAACIETYLPVHIALFAITVLQAIFGLILSCSACCNVCRCCCCYKEPINGFVASPPITTFVHIQQPSVPYRPLTEEQFSQPPDYDHVTFK